MLQSLREKFMGWPGVIIFGTLGLLMAIAFGLGSYNVSRGSTWAAKVNKHEISKQDFQTQMNKLRQQMSQRQGSQFDPSYFSKREVKQQVIDQMIARYLLVSKTADLGLTVTDNDVRRQIAAIPAFQTNGKFDPATYRAALANRGMTPSAFQKQVHDSLETGLLPGLVTAGSLISPKDVDNYLRIKLETRDVAYVQLTPPEPSGKKITNTQISDYYKAHKSDFVRPEKVAINYIELDASKLDVSKELEDASLKARYEQEKNRFVEPEQRKIAHIFIKVPSDAGKKQHDAALAKAEKIDAEAKANKDGFAALAKKYSDDLGSKNSGGKLGWLQKGVVGPAFDKVVFSMKKDQVSKPVLGQDGYHIIKLLGIRKGEVKPFSEVRDALKKEVAGSAKERKYSQLAGRLTDMVYADPSSLKPAAKKLGLSVQHTGLFSRAGGDDSVTSHAKVIAAAFSEDAIKNDMTPDPVILGDTKMVVLHVAKHQVAKQLSAKQAHDSIVKHIRQEQMAKEAKQRADKLLAKLKSIGNLKQFAKKQGLDIESADTVTRIDPILSPVMRKKVFAMPQPGKNGKPVFSSMALGNGKYALVALKATHAGNPDDVPDNRRKSLLGYMQQMNANTFVGNWVKQLKENAKIKLSKDMQKDG